MTSQLGQAKQGPE